MHSQDKLKTEDLKYSMGGKLADIPFSKQMYKPGPGQHDPKVHDGSRKPTFPLESARAAVEKPGPAPNNYEQVPSSIKKKNPKYGVGTSDRFDIRQHVGTLVSKDIVKYPGPGTYGAENGFYHPSSKSMASKLYYNLSLIHI